MLAIICPFLAWCRGCFVSIPFSLQFYDLAKFFFMYTKKYLFAAGLTLCLLPAIGNAQTVSTFDDLTLPGADTNFANTQSQGAYSFQSGHVVFYGELTSWGGYQGFNYSNMKDDTTQDFSNDKSAITGIGYDSSDNYGVCYVPLDFQGADPTATLPVGTALKQDAAGFPVSGAYITNTTYAYWYMKNYFQPGNWFQLTIRGYLNGQPSADSITFMLGKVTDSTSEIINEWTWVDLTTLGAVDSLTFDLGSNDTAGGFGMNNPSYFAIDNLTTQDENVDTGDNGIAALNEAALAFDIWPNPAQKILHIAAENPVDVMIYDFSGRMVWKGEKVNKIPLSGLSSGIYILTATDCINRKTGSMKFLKE